jgi:hypothetical protein
MGVSSFVFFLRRVPTTRVVNLESASVDRALVLACDGLYDVCRYPCWVVSCFLKNLPVATQKLLTWSIAESGERKKCSFVFVFNVGFSARI